MQQAAGAKDAVTVWGAPVRGENWVQPGRQFGAVRQGRGRGVGRCPCEGQLQALGPLCWWVGGVFNTWWC